jgi:hypothetical protein
MTDLTRSKSILELDNITVEGAHFQQTEEDGYASKVLRISLQDYNDFGKPNKLTLTIEPGDNLNVDKS